MTIRLIMADQSTQQVTTNPTVGPNSFYGIAQVTMPAGTPVFQTTTKGVVSPAKSNAAGTTYVLGLTVNGVQAGDQVEVQFAGPLTLSLAEWSAIVGGSTGLTTGTTYYVSAATPGLLVPIEGISREGYAAVVGTATSPVCMALAITLAVLQ